MITDEVMFRVWDSGDDFADVYHMTLERDMGSHTTVVLMRTHKWRVTYEETDEKTEQVFAWRGKHLQKLIDALQYMQAKSSE